MILLDTHVLVWLDAGSSKLGRTARSTIDAALRDSSLVVASITFWEVAMLVDRGRLTLPMPVREWRRDLGSVGLREIPLDGEVAIDAAMLRGFHGDPADRIVTAVAVAQGATLVTADRAILEWSGDLRRLDGRT